MLMGVVAVKEGLVVAQVLTEVVFKALQARVGSWTLLCFHANSLRCTQGPELVMHSVYSRHLDSFSAGCCFLQPRYFCMCLCWLVLVLHWRVPHVHLLVRVLHWTAHIRVCWCMCCTGQLIYAFAGALLHWTAHICVCWCMCCTGQLIYAFAGALLQLENFLVPTLTCWGAISSLN